MSTISQKLYDTAFKYEENNGGCCQCVLGSVKTNLGNISDNLFQAATAMAGGVAASGNTCGACTGAILALGAFKGRDWENFSTSEGNDIKNEMTWYREKSLNALKTNSALLNAPKFRKSFSAKATRCMFPRKKPLFLKPEVTVLTAAPELLLWPQSGLEKSSKKKAL